jgi:hypothetical protein
LIVGPQTSYCAPVPPNYYWTGYSIQSQFPTADAGCADAASHFGYTVTSTVIDSTGLRAACYAQPAGQSKPVNFAAVSRTNNVIPAPTTYAPATGDDIAGALKLKMIADSNARKAMYDAIKSDLASNPGLQNDSTNPVQQTTPVSVTAPPVTSPVSSPSIQTIQNPDGTTSTQTTTQQTTVTPTTTGTTVGDVKTTFPSTTTTTVTTTNNTTNQTTTSTTVSNNPSPLKLPDDYNREVTQQQVEKDLNTDAAPPMDDQQKVIADAGTKGDADRQKIYDGIQSGQSDKSAWFSWVWSPPVGVCSPITGVIAGFHVEWDLCPTIAIIQAILGWLMAIFSAAEVYGQLFKRGD